VDVAPAPAAAPAPALAPVPALAPPAAPLAPPAPPAALSSGSESLPSPSGIDGGGTNPWVLGPTSRTRTMPWKLTRLFLPPGDRRPSAAGLAEPAEIDRDGGVFDGSGDVGALSLCHFGSSTMAVSDGVGQTREAKNGDRAALSGCQARRRIQFWTSCTQV
jgi:hypothetical protein